jgi:hypothetical protein
MRLRRQIWASGIAAVAMASGVCAGQATANQGRTPIVIELFTSEGCSSCPPVDNWATWIDRAQPVPGAEVIVLSEHVDYWNSDGWKDPFSSSLYSARQKEYAQAIGLSGIYTPQLVVDGSDEMNLQNTAEVKHTLDQDARAEMLPVKIEAVTVTPGQPGDVAGRVEADATGQKHSGDVYVAVTMRRTLTDVLAGENDGKKLTNVDVVRDLVKVGKLSKGKTLDEPFKVTLWPGADAANVRVVAFVQESGMGKVVGAAMVEAAGQENQSASLR